MNKEKHEKLDAERCLSVVKRNDLIQSSHFHLSAQEQKMALFLISKIQPGDEDFKVYEFKLHHFCEVCEINTRSGKNYSDLYNAIKKLADKSLWAGFTNDDTTLIRWIENPTINEKKGVIKVKFDEHMKPFLLQLKGKFTSYELHYALAMKSKYSIRLYEILKSYQNLEKCEFTVEQLKKLLDAENYKQWIHFKDNALGIAVSEINECSDILVRYELEKKGRAFHQITFFIAPNSKDIDEGLKTIMDMEKLLNKSPDSPQT